MRKSRIAIIFFCGLLSGIMTAEGLEALSGRDGWHVGGEVLILPLMFALLYMGVIIGRLIPERRRDHERRR